MMIQLLSILVLCGAAVHGNWESVLSWQAKTTLLQLSDHLQIESIRSDPVPIYREDLSTDYVAYWYIPINKDEYIIISSSAKTGDYKLVMQGSSSLLEELDEAAVAKNTQCSKYYMVTPTPDINLSCQDSEGQMIFVNKDIDVSKDELAKLWENQKINVEREQVWDRSMLTNNDVFFRALEKGDNHKFAIGDSLSLGIHAMNGNQASLCRVLGICQLEDNSLVDPKAFEITKYGQNILNINLPETNEEFQLTLYTSDNGEVVGQRVMISAQSASKRDTTATEGPWTSFSIPDENLFPDYNQHDINCHKGWLFNTNKMVCCSVGCGPVAWAMILGYYDRRSHDKPSTYTTGSQRLYGCGVDASNGTDSCEAPKYLDSRVKKLTEHLNHDFGTFCLQGQGATTQGSMQKFEVYFKAHQTTGNPNVTIHSNGITSFVGSYSDDIRDYAMSYIKDKWPVVVGIRVGGIFSQHYPVATRFRQRTKKECAQNLLNTMDCTTSSEYEMYLHMGWGGSKNGWRVAQMFMAGVARY